MPLALPSQSANRTTSGSGATTSPIVTAPSGLADGEALLDIVAFNSSSLITPTAPTGHTSVLSALGAATTRQGIVYRRTPTASEPGSVSWSHTAALVWNIVQLRLTGADTSNLIIDQNSATAASSTSCTAPSLTNDTVGALLLYVGIVRTTSATITSYPAGMTVVSDQVTGATSNNTRLVVAYELLASTGATGTRTATISTAQDSLGLAVIIRPAAAAVVSSTVSSGMRLALGIFAGPGGPLLLDATSRASNIEMSTGEHGFQSLTADLALTPTEAFQLYDRPGLPHVVLSCGAQTVWEGRLEDVRLTFDDDASGAAITALGYWRALSDTLYTAFWSSTRVTDWLPINAQQLANRTPERWELDNNNRLYFAPRKNERFGTPTFYAGSYTLEIPNGSLLQIGGFSFEYNVLMPGSWRIEVAGQTRQFNGHTSLWVLDATGVLQTGAQTLTFAGVDRLVISVFYNAAEGVYSGETGQWRTIFTNLRAWATTPTPITTATIATHLVQVINGNGGLSLSTALIQSPGLDRRDEVIEDARPAAILDRLVQLGDTQGRRWEAGVWDERRLHVRPRGAAGRTWYVDAGSLTIERTLESLANSVYSVYEDANGRAVRSATATDAASAARYGLARHRTISSPTTSATQAVAERDVALQDSSNPRPRAAIQVAAIYDATGAPWPLWAVRAGDTLIVRSLPPTLSTTIDRVRSFVVAQTQYTVDTDALQLQPEEPLAALETLIMQRDDGS